MGPRGLVVAVVGPDGAGKSTLCRALEREAPLRAQRIHLGTNSDAEHTLAVSRWLRPRRSRYGGSAPRAGAVLRLADLAGRVARHRVRHLLAVARRARGRMIVFDRYELLSRRDSQVTPRDAVRRWLLHGDAPKPDVGLVLDVPSAVLHLRTREHKPERLERMRDAGAQIACRNRDAVVLDATRSERGVLRAATSLLWQRLAGRRGLPECP